MKDFLSFCRIYKSINTKDSKGDAVVYEKVVVIFCYGNAFSQHNT